MLKKLTFTLSLAVTLLASEKEKSFWEYHPLHLEGSAVFVAPSDISKSPEKGTLRFSKGETGAHFMVPLSKKSQFFPHLGWGTLTCDWNKNTLFREKNFSYYKTGMHFCTTAVENWRWIIGSTYTIDTKYASKIKTYGQLGTLIWGMHPITESLNVHIGSLFYIGLRRDDPVYPVIGLDYTINESWLIKAIFPLDYRVEYKVLPNLSLSLKARAFSERFRTGKNEAQPRSIFQYSATGGEINLQYQIEHRLDAQLFAGYQFGGTYYIKDQMAKTATYMGFSPAPYLGAKLDFGF